MAQLNHYNNIKKSIITLPERQQRFVPILLQAENTIKELIVEFWFFSRPRAELYNRILAIIYWTDKRLPLDITDRQAYIDGLMKSSQQMMRKVYVEAQKDFLIVSQYVKNIYLKYNVRLPKIESPNQLQKLIKAKLNNRDVWAEAKGTPYIENYQQKIVRAVKSVSQTPTTTSESGKKAISLIQKAELNTRYEAQMEMVDNLRTQGVEYAWISTHANCSKRCEKWQGKLVALNLKSNREDFLIGDVDGNKCYSLSEIMDQTDKYGYHNNIICGFNCRHRLIPYKRGSFPPKDYSASQVKRNRKIETNIRAMEREIINLKEERNALLAINDLQQAEKLSKIIKGKVAYYKRYCEANGYAWTPFRIGQGIL